jgi:predicted transcriptional regulator
MRVERIYTRTVVHVPCSASIEAAAALMRDRHVGALLVTREAVRSEEAVGILTDRDIVVQAVARGFDVREMTVADLMTPTIGAIGEGADLHEALEMMRAGGVRRLVVRRGNGAVAGILSMDDAIDGLSADLASLAALVKTEREREREELDDLPAI